MHLDDHAIKSFQWCFYEIRQFIQNLLNWTEVRSGLFKCQSDFQHPVTRYCLKYHAFTMGNFLSGYYYVMWPMCPLIISEVFWLLRKRRSNCWKQTYNMHFWKSALKTTVFLNMILDRNRCEMLSNSFEAPWSLLLSSTLLTFSWDVSYTSKVLVHYINLAQQLRSIKKKRSSWLQNFVHLNQTHLMASYTNKLTFLSLECTWSLLPRIPAGHI